MASPINAVSGIDFKELCLEISGASCRRLGLTNSQFRDFGKAEFLQYLEGELQRRPTRLGSWTSRLQAFVDYVETSGWE